MVDYQKMEEIVKQNGQNTGKGNAQPQGNGGNSTKSAGYSVHPTSGSIELHQVVSGKN